MNPVLRVLECGPGVTVQDAGRVGLRRFGVAWAGAADLGALALANALAGNEIGMAALEVPVSGAAFCVEGGRARIAVIGADLSIDGQSVPPATAADAAQGACVTLQPAEGFVYAYVAVSGGIGTLPEMGSRATHVRSGLGGRALAAGDLLPCGPAPERPCLRLGGKIHWPSGPIRLVRGPQEDRFPTDSFANLLAGAWRPHHRSDRMGMRLEGPRISHREGADIVSDAVLPGAVQVPGDGRPIVLMRDCQTTGGYPKIACVIAADLDRLAQSPAGATMTFVEVSPDEGLLATRAWRQLLRDIPSRLAPVGLEPRLLHEVNLIDGVHAPPTEET
jgi:5-oxoprolinase (ATP-hydrolysing) subunit C